MHQKKIPYYKPGGKMVYFKKQDLLDWKSRNRVGTDEEMRIAAATYIALNKKGTE
jgi:hypothetical protein